MSIGRRGVLQGSAMGVGASVLDGCVGQNRPPAFSLPPAELAKTLERMDVVIGAIQSSKPDPIRFGAKIDSGKAAYGHDRIAKSLTTMHLVATFRDLPVETQIDPEVQRRMWRALPHVHDSTMETVDFLDALGPEERRRIDERLRADPDLPMRVLEKLDDDAARLGVPATHRARMRTIGAHVTWRLKNQGAGVVFDEIVGTMDRAIARRGADVELERAVAAKVAEAQLFGMPTDPPQSDPLPTTSDAPGVLRAHFRTPSGPQAVQRASCSLDAKLQVDGRSRPLDIAGCSQQPLEGGIKSNVRVTRQATGTDWDVTLEIDVPEGTTPAGVDELKQAIRDTARELRRRSELKGSEGTQTTPTSAPLVADPATKTRGSSRALTVAAISWGIAAAFGIPGLILVAVGSSDSNGGGSVIGGAFLLTPASIAALVGIVALIVAAAVAAGED